MEKVINEYLDKLDKKLKRHFEDITSDLDKNAIEKVYDLDLDYGGLVFAENTLKLKVTMKCKVDYIYYGELEDIVFEETLYLDDLEINTVCNDVFRNLEQYIYDNYEFSNDTYDEDER